MVCLLDRGAYSPILRRERPGSPGIAIVAAITRVCVHDRAERGNRQHGPPGRTSDEGGLRPDLTAPLSPAYRAVVPIPRHIAEEHDAGEWLPTGCAGWSVRDLVFHLRRDAQRALVALAS